MQLDMLPVLNSQYSVLLAMLEVLAASGTSLCMCTERLHSFSSPTRLEMMLDYVVSKSRSSK